ncbi:MAG TPA: hypothetical protein VFS13_16120 [Steroidobacteraceae bacterium]|nr:hypothetical protein [Steroidobacteraceae bacterium]
MTTDREMEDVVVTSAQGEELVELGAVTTDTKGTSGYNFWDGGAGYWF